jgi:hypothetical protein
MASVSRGVSAAAFALCILASFSQVSPCFGQGTTGTLEGTIVDTSGAAVPGASVLIKSVSTNLVRTVTSDSKGRYAVDTLNPGTYTLTVTAPGFGQKVTQGIQLAVSSNQEVDVSLQAGGVSEEVSVNASVALTQTESSENGQVIDNKKVVELPLANRQFYALALLSPAAYQPAQDSVLGFRGGFNVAGAPEISNQFTVDGTYDNDIGTGQPSFRPSIETIQEFKILTGVYSAEYGRMAGGQIIVATKSGGNSLHGSTYEFIRNQVTDSKPYFNTPDSPNPAFKQNTFGATIGGPVVLPHLYNGKDKTFFFFGYEGQRIRQQIEALATVPTPLMLGGCIDVGTQINDPTTGLPLPSSTTGACASLPAGTTGAYDITKLPLWSSSGAQIGQQLAAISFPAPSSATALGTVPGDNYNFSETRQETMNENSVRIDHTFNPSNSIYATYNWFHDTAFEPSNSLCSALVLPKFGCYTGQESTLANINYDHIFSSTKLNEIRFGFERLIQPRVSEDDTNASTAAFPGLSGAFNNSLPTNKGIPFTTINGYSTFGGAPNLPQDRTDDHWQLIDTFSWTRGAHSFKFGADLFEVKNTSFYIEEGRGELDFNSGEAQGDGAATSGYEISDLLLGLPTTTTNSPIQSTAHNRYESYHFFAVDDWKVTKYLTLNLGLRYEVDAPVHDAHDQLSNFNLASGAFEIAGPSTYTRLYHWDLNNFAPRIGFALQPFEKDSTVLKGGFGLFYDQPLLYNNFYEFSLQYPFYNPQTFYAGASSGIGAISLSNPFPSSSLEPECLSDATPSSSCAATIVPYAVPKSYATPYITQWSLGIQQALTRSLVFETTYFGTKGTRLPLVTNHNQTPLGSASQSVGPYPNFLQVYTENTVADSSFQSWQNSLRQNLSHGVSFLLAYTYGKSLDDGDVIGTFSDAEAGSDLPQDSTNLRGDRGRSDFDVRHRIVFSPVAQLPFGRGRAHLSSGVPALLAGGWQVSGIFSYQTGRPFTVFDGDNPNNSGTFSYADRPNIVSGKTPNNGPKVPAEWFDVSAFAQAPPGQFGNEGRNSINGPGYVDLDATVARTFKIVERVSGEFRAEAFNLANHPNFLNPNDEAVQFPLGSTTGGPVQTLPATPQPAFGAITTANSNREFQFGLRILY